MLGMCAWGWFQFTACTCDPKQCPSWNVQVVQMQLPPTAQLVRDIAQHEVERLSLCLQSQASLYKVIYKKLSVGSLKRIV